MARVTVDPRLRAVLAGQSLTLESVPARGRDVRLSISSEASEGGTAIDVLDDVHSENREAAARAAAQLGVDVAAVHFLSPDIARSWREGAGWIVKVDASPSLRPHRIANPAQDVATPIVRHMFPENREARIPTAGITGSIGKTTTCQMLAGMGRAAGKTVGLTTTQGAWSGEFQTWDGDCANGSFASGLLTDPTIDLGIFEMARGALNKWGMFVEDFDVACVLNVHDNHVGLDGIETREDLAAVKSLIVGHARRAVVLNADDPLVLAMRKLAKVPVTLVAMSTDNPEIAMHRERGGCAVVLEGSGDRAAIRLYEAGKAALEMPVGDIPAARAGRSRSVTANAMFAIATAHRLGIPEASIRSALADFTSSYEQNPGRHNWIEGLPFELILNKADGSVALGDIIETSNEEPTSGVRSILLTAPGNRSDEWIRELGRTAAGHFDRYYCAEMESFLRGREPGTAPALLVEGLRSRGVPEEAIVLEASQARAIAAMLNEARAGDRVILANIAWQESAQLIEKFMHDQGLLP